MVRHVESRESKDVVRTELPGRRPRGRPKTRYMDVVTEDIKSVVGEEDSDNGGN